MMRMAAFITISVLAVFSAGFGAADAQSADDYQRRQTDLENLSEIFGELHHLRRTCEPRREADTWRGKMKTLLDLEEPPTAEREKMVQRFNAGYRRAQSRYYDCDRPARDYAAARAAQGDTIVRRLAQPLFAAMREEQANVAPE